MGEVKVGIAGVGNCASALIQGVHYYSKQMSEDCLGLTSYSLGGISPKDVKFVAAFDVQREKVGLDLADAIFKKPNNALKICDVPKMGIKVKKGPVLDGIGKYIKDVVRTSNDPRVDVAQELKDVGADLLIGYLPVGSSLATKFYASEALKAGTAFISPIPVFIASDPEWQRKFHERGLPVAGDDVMSQLGATVLHKTLVKLCVDRGVKVDETYQINIGGDTDFLNMLEESRLVDKRESKTSAVRAMSEYRIPTKIGPSDYVTFLENDKVCYVWLKGRYFGGVPVTIDVKLRVADAYNSGGVMIDAIRATKLALDRGISGPLISASAYCFKHPPVQMPYNEAKRAFMEFVEGRRER